jgi:rubrerythrin
MILPAKNSLRWRVEEIDFEAIDPTLVRDDEFLFMMLASASFVEILAQTYSRNLIQHFSGDTDATTWLDSHWQIEEVQHGRALKAYLQAVWPEFDWEKAHAEFRIEYSRLCTLEQLEEIPALEMIGRCVVETGTATFYTALHDYVREPVLRQILANIKVDEAAHYSQFRRYFETYNRVDRHGTWAVLLAIWRRTREIQSEDAYIAFKHVQREHAQSKSFCEDDWLRFSRKVKSYARRYYPYTMAVSMLIKPIPMFEPLKAVLRWGSMGVARLYSVRR